MMEEQQRLLVEVLDLFALRFDKHAVLRGGMVLRILGCERLTNDLDYVFVPYRSKKDIAGDVLEALRSLAGVTISHTLNSKCLRVSISRGDVAIQVLRQAESERDTAFRAAAGVLTKNDRPVVMILRPGDICRDGDLYVSSLEGGTYAADVGKKISDSYHMPHFRPITPLRVGWHWRWG